MKRSDINRAYLIASRCFTANGWALLPHFKWDITDFGLGRFDQWGLVLINLADEKEYCEKLMYAEAGQHTPAHYHEQKKKDIICRLGELCMQVWDRDDKANPGRSFEIKVNGAFRTVRSGQLLLLRAGERVTLEPGVWHEFWPESEQCIICEVSTANDNAHDNFFDNADVGRFPHVEEDEEPLINLLSDKKWMMERKGILAVGNFIVDSVKLIDLWPPQESLADIQHQHHSNGGGAYNVLKDLAAMQSTFPLEAAGLVGNDHWGRWIREDCMAHAIDVGMLGITDECDTSYTDVMTLADGGKRTFFHYRGANAMLNRSHINLQHSRARIFHLAYILLLDRLDKLDDFGISEAARLLQEATERGFITSADLVSVHDPGFSRIVRPCLPYTDILFLNEFEAERITGIQVFQDGRFSPSHAQQACHELLSAGVRQWAILHCPDGAVAMGADGAFFLQGSVQLPKSLIAGTVGAGDAFAAGMLMGIHEKWPMDETLRLAVGSAAACLLHPTSSGGLLPTGDCLGLGTRYGYRKL
jgi:D-lyxose ketol-isomerase/sugar/nucleoside kinase (ribokinase family)